MSAYRTRAGSMVVLLAAVAMIGVAVSVPAARADTPDPAVGSWAAPGGMVYEIHPAGPDRYSIFVSDPNGMLLAVGGCEPGPELAVATMTGPGPTYTTSSPTLSGVDGHCVAGSNPARGTWTIEPGGVVSRVCWADSDAACGEMRRVGAPPAPQPQPSVPVAAGSAKTGRPLCSQAVDAFGPDGLRQAGITDPSAPTTIQLDGNELAGQLRAAISTYDAAHPDQSAYATDGTPVAGELGALGWLFTERGVSDRVAKAFTTGQEVNLRAAIIAESNNRAVANEDRHLTPGDVLGLALQLQGGDVNQALLTAHNTLRALARGKEGDVVGVYGDQGFFSAHLVALHAGDSAGPWYHLFGTAYMEMTVKGDWGPWLATGGGLFATGAGAAGVAAGVLTGGAGLALTGAVAAYLAHKYQSAGDSSGASGASQVFNGLEQVYHEGRGGPLFGTDNPNKPDPEKYCFNVWGAQIGKVLYDSLPNKSVPVLHALVSRFAAPPPTADTTAPTDEGHFVNAIESPFSVEWRDGAHVMVLDQGDDPNRADLLGGVPGMVVPVDEGPSWGAAWIPPAGDNQTVTFEAVRAGARLHFTRLDTTTGTVATYEATASSAHQRFTVHLDGVTAAPSLVRDDGVVVKPEVVVVRPPSPSGRAWLLVALGGLLLCVGGVVAFRRPVRRRADRVAVPA